MKRLTLIFIPLLLVSCTNKKQVSSENALIGPNVEPVFRHPASPAATLLANKKHVSTWIEESESHTVRKNGEVLFHFEQGFSELVYFDEHGYPIRYISN